MKNLPLFFRTPQFLSVLVVCIGILLLYLPTKGFLTNQYDDSYITYRYAVNLAEGKGLVFNTDEKADAASSFFYTILLAGSYKVGVTNLEAVAGVIGIGSALGIVFIVSTILWQTTKQKWISFLAGTTVGLHGFISGWAISGMETVLFTFLITWFIYCFYFQKKRNEILIPILLILILLTRIEGVILIGVWGLHRLIEIFQKKKQIIPFLLQTIVIGGVFVGFYAFKYLYYGSLESNAVGFKQIASYYQTNIPHMLLSWGGASLLLLLISLGGIKRFWNASYWSLFLFIGLSIISFLIGPHSDGARYTIHLLPIVCIFAFTFLFDLFKTEEQKKKLIPILFCLGIIGQTLLSSIVVQKFMTRFMEGQECRSQLGTYLSKTLPEGFHILSGDVGMIAYRAKEQNIIDLAGLTSKDILEKYQQKALIDPVLEKKQPAVLADTFFYEEGVYKHLLLTNKVEHIMGMKEYSRKFTDESFKNPLLTCSDGVRAYAIFPIGEKR